MPPFKRQNSVPPPLSVGQPVRLAASEENKAEVTACDLRDEVVESPLVSSFPSRFTRPGESQPPCYKDTQAVLQGASPMW